MKSDRQINTSDISWAPYAHSAPRSRAAALIDWILGTRPVDEERDWEQPSEPEIVVAAPSEHTSWVDSFHTALTEAATSFILQHVDYYHREDPTAGFAIKRVKVGFHQAASSCLRAIQSMPPAMRDRIVLLRIKKARGAEQLMLDHFYGMSILAEETLVDGQLVETMVSYKGSRFQLRFEFEGEYCVLPTSSQAAATPDSSSKTGGSPHATTLDNHPAAVHAVEPDMQSTPSRNEQSAAQGFSSRETPLYCPPSAHGSGRDTPLHRPSKPLRNPVARLHLAARGAQTVVELFEDGFPYTIGRHPEAPGFVVRPRNGTSGGSADASLLAHTQTPDAICYVSREHLALNAPDLASGEILVDNLSAQKGRNGTYVNGVAKPHRFIYPLDAQHQLCLGGSDGDGILRLNLEPA